MDAVISVKSLMDQKVLAHYQTDIPLNTGTIIAETLNSEEFYKDYTSEKYSQGQWRACNISKIRQWQLDMLRDGYARTNGHSFRISGEIMLDVYPKSSVEFAV
jgi:hypothetical protein